MSGEAPIAVLASSAGGAVLVAELQRRAPHEDVVMLADNAYAPYARRPGRVVVDRVGRMATDLLAHAPKLLILASSQGTEDALPALRARVGVPVIGLDGMVVAAAARSPGGTVAVVTGAGCRRGLQQGRSLRHERGGVAVGASAWPGLRELADAGRGGSPAARELVRGQVDGLRAAGVTALLLACPHAWAVRSAVEEAAGSDLAVVDGAAVVADRALRTLRRDGLLAHRKRAGRRILIATDPARAQRGLAVR